MTTKKTMGVLVAALIGCGVQAADEPVSFKDDVQPILDSQCVFCHVTGAENGGLNLGRRVSHAALLGPSSQTTTMPRVTPGDPARSYLVHKLRGTQLEAGGHGAQMPMYDPPKPFAPEHLETLERWIRQGAPKN